MNQKKILRVWRHEHDRHVESGRWVVSFEENGNIFISMFHADDEIDAYNQFIKQQKEEVLNVRT